MTPLRAPRLTAFAWLDHGFGTRLDGAWTPPEQTAALHQIHTSEVVPVVNPGHHGDGDALITSQPGVWLEIRTADCVPLLIADPRQRVIAAVHAGWRGTAMAIAKATVQALEREFNCRPADLEVVIGPCIASCCFEVGDEVVAHFPGHITHSSPRPHVNLVTANREQLGVAGVQPDRIDSLDLCTACNPNLFHSFRRDQGTGRMVSAIQLRNQGVK
jgi:YfiH family protein